MNYEESLKDYRDMYSVMKTQLEKGREEGLAKGREEGLVKGREEGIAIGKLQAILASARAFIEHGIPRDIVQKTLGLTDEQMKAL